MSTLATETWTGANNATWPSQWTLTNGMYDIQSNRGRLTPQANPYNVGIGRAVLNVPFSVDQDLTAEFMLPAVGVEQYHYFGVRTSGTPDKNTGFLLSIFPGGFVIARGYDGANLSGDIAFSYAANTAYRFRLRAIGSLLQARVWLASSPEPTAWAYSDANAAGQDLTPGTVTISAGNGAGSVSRVLLVDSLTLTDGVSAPVYSGAVALGGEGTQTRSGAPRTASSVALSGAATQSLAGTPSPASEVRLSGNGALGLAGSAGGRFPLDLSGTAAQARAGVPSLHDRLDLEALADLDLAGAPSLAALVGFSGTGTLRLSGRALVARVPRRADVGVPSSRASIRVTTNTRQEVRVP